MMFTEAPVSMRKLMFVSQIRVSTVGVFVTLLMTAKTNIRRPHHLKKHFQLQVHYLSHLMIRRFTDSSKMSNFLAPSALFPFGRTGREVWEGTNTITASICGTKL